MRDFWVRVCLGALLSVIVVTIPAYGGESALNGAAPSDNEVSVNLKKTEGGSSGAIGLEEIVVTAQKREERLQDVPMSVVAVRDKDLIEKGIKDLPDLAQAVPDLQVVDSGGAGGREIYMRGVGNSVGSSTMVGVYLDESSITPPAVFPGLQLDLPFDDLDRVEVLRGPQGTLYGASSMGGTLRFLTKDPQLAEINGSVSVDASTINSGGTTERVEGVLDVPVVRNELGFRLAAYYEDFGGWMDQPAVGRSNINDDRVANARLKGLWRPSDALEIKSTVLVHHTEAGAPSTGEDQHGNFTQVSLAPTSTPSGKNDYNLFNLTVTYDLGPARLLSTSTYLNYELLQHNKGYRIPLAGPPSTTAPYDVLADLHEELRNFTQELRLTSTGSGPFKWTLGGFATTVTHNYYAPYELAQPTNPSVIIPVLFDEKDIPKSSAAFGEVGYQVTKQWEVGAGVRISTDQAYYHDVALSTFQSQTFHDTSPRVYVRYAATDHIGFYASAAKGYRPGGFNSFGQPSYEPESIWSYELGAKASVLNGKLDAEVALFDSDYKNAQTLGINFTSGSFVSYVKNIGTATIKGLDWNLALHVTDRFSVGSSGAYIDGYYTEINAVNADERVGDSLDFIPKYHFTLWSSYGFNWSDALPGYVRLDYSDTGREFKRELTLGPWYYGMSDVIHMVNARVGMTWKDWSFSAYARNILNDRGFLDAWEYVQLGTRATPRTLGVQAVLKF